MRILIVDDHAIVREGLKRILSEIVDADCIGEAANGLEAMELIRKQSWDTVLLDIAMPGKSGLELLKVIKGENPALPVLVLSIYPQDQYEVRVLAAGASGYLNKETAPEQLVAAVKKVTRGRKWISEATAERLASGREADSIRPLHERLSDREFDVLRMIASGKTVGQIAEELHLSVKTVSSHRSRILKKMGMQNNAELANYGIRQGLVF
jgi:two-component system, NarL family, invasion response regulator UvrY